MKLPSMSLDPKLACVCRHSALWSWTPVCSPWSTYNQWQRKSTKWKGQRSHTFRASSSPPQTASAESMSFLFLCWLCFCLHMTFMSPFYSTSHYLSLFSPIRPLVNYWTMHKVLDSCKVFLCILSERGGARCKGQSSERIWLAVHTQGHTNLL